MTISVAMCTYNGAAFLREQLDSIAAQTRLPDEMVVCDDCSTDETTAILEAFAACASFPVRVSRNAVNLGSTKNFEQAISLCRNEIIALSDQDDVWLPTKLAKLEQPFADPAVGLVFTDADLVDDTLNPLGIRLWDAYFSAEAQRQMKAGKAFQVQLDGNVVTGATLAFRSELREIALPIPDSLHLIHDGWIALVIAAVSELVFLPEPLILYRQHSGQQIGVAMHQHKQKLSVLPRQHYTDHLLQLEQVGGRLTEVSRQHFGNSLSANVQKSSLYRQRIQAHAQHLRVRLAMPSSWLVRGFLVSDQLLTGRYHQHSNGLRSAVRDFLYPLNTPKTAQEAPKTRNTRNAGQHKMTRTNPLESLVRFLICRLRTLRMSRCVRDVFWINTILDARVWPANISVDEQGKLVLPDLDIRLTKDRHTFFVPLIVLARQLAEAGEATFFNDAEGGLFARFGEVTLEIAGPTDFPLFVEVIARHIYRVVRPDPSQQVVWDIGFNVGAVSLYYAAQPEVIAVYGYEPLPVAYQQGLKNIALNPALAEKITVFPEGVGKADECLTFGYAAWAITSAGAYGMLVPEGRVMPEEEKATVNLRAAATVLSEIRQAHPHAKLVVKMDCEGSEQDIIPALSAAGLLGEIDMAIIETHFPETQEMVQLLSQAGFRVFNPQYSRDIGMIFASRA